MQQDGNSVVVDRARFAELRDLAAEIFSATPEEVEAAESFVDDLGADSLLAIELVSRLEQVYDVVVDPEDIPLLVDLNTTYRVVAAGAGW
ncbi:MULTISPECIES: acyl carrier protein [Kitasatospora]|uniref:Putative acyl carrier protein n=1 Tax=Kitasatospora setae (strain ATCC 33774 / DSM 43861 / JCM 3304 / KCC A-0304 / NBRC 14216 / KM-6054) TaxID=452652 RepID=E4N2H2_KITSK|nr:MULTISPECIES: acyl carrier protein [Kitasatospora]BAJ32356.1 putative acyl carrier protein [Kitasatospora setae KM-6054]